MKKNYQKGEVVDVNLGEIQNEVKGHEQGNLRPCIIIKPFTILELAVIIPCTTKEPPNSIYTIVKLSKGNGGLTMDSYALCHQIRVISFDRITSLRGKIDPTDFLKIKSVVIDMLEN